jgi:UDP-N-acetylglucosamine diphosphorylase / glucose-1-phosphate thymidylyltransferase / UDP-N-acetylgalactosamine diphosphorylase / glucosamine-1-phosphate N-acetyltransferase / galactosamine-1-phosphate N-acetyltransferase
MKGIILAAGKGTRLRPWTNTTPKPLLMLNGKPILSYILEGFAGAGVDDLQLVVGYLGGQVRDFYGGSFGGMKITYYEQKEQLGTAHALLLAEEALKNAAFMMSWGDILCEPENYPALREFHEKNNFTATITLNEVDDPYAGAAVYVRDGRVTEIIEKPPKGQSTTKWNNRGIFVFQPEIFDEVHSLEMSPRGEYELPQAIGKMVDRGVPVGGMPVTGFNSDIGTIEEFHEYENYLKSR